MGRSVPSCCGLDLERARQPEPRANDLWLTRQCDPEVPLACSRAGPVRTAGTAPRGRPGGAAGPTGGCRHAAGELDRRDADPRSPSASRATSPFRAPRAGSRDCRRSVREAVSPPLPCPGQAPRRPRHEWRCGQQDVRGDLGIAVASRRHDEESELEPTRRPQLARVLDHDILRAARVQDRVAVVLRSGVEGAKARVDPPTNGAPASGTRVSEAAKAGAPRITPVGFVGVRGHERRKDRRDRPSGSGPASRRSPTGTSSRPRWRNRAGTQSCRLTRATRRRRGPGCPRDQVATVESRSSGSARLPIGAERLAEGNGRTPLSSNLGVADRAFDMLASSCGNRSTIACWLACRREARYPRRRSSRWPRQRAAFWVRLIARSCPRRSPSRPPAPSRTAVSDPQRHCRARPPFERLPDRRTRPPGPCATSPAIGCSDARVRAAARGGIVGDGHRTSRTRMRIGGVRARRRARGVGRARVRARRIGETSRPASRTSRSRRTTPGLCSPVALSVYAAVTFFRASDTGHWRDAFPPHYGGLGLGCAFLVAWIVLDIVWRNVAGIKAGGMRTPSRRPASDPHCPRSSPQDRHATRSQRGRSADSSGRDPCSLAGVVAVGSLRAVTLSTFSRCGAIAGLRRPSRRRQLRDLDMARPASNKTRVLPALAPVVDYSLPVWSPGRKRIATPPGRTRATSPRTSRTPKQTRRSGRWAADGSDRKLVRHGSGRGCAGLDSRLVAPTGSGSPTTPA